MVLMVMSGNASARHASARRRSHLPVPRPERVEDALPHLAAACA
jgi:hypothetical protein